MSCASWFPPFAQSPRPEAILPGASVPTLRDRHGFTPLHYAVYDQVDAEVVRALIELGANVSVRDQKRESPLELAERLNETELSLRMTEWSNANIRSASGVMRRTY